MEAFNSEINKVLLRLHFPANMHVRVVCDFIIIYLLLYFSPIEVTKLNSSLQVYRV